MFEQVDRHRQHFAHDCHQRRARLSTPLYQTTIVSPKGGALRVNAAQRCQIENAPEQATAPFGEFGFPFPEATFFDFDIQTAVGNRLVRATKAADIPQFGTQQPPF